MINGIDHIDIAVTDLEASVSFFVKMGFQIIRRQKHKGGTAELALPGVNQFILDLHPVVPDYRNGLPGLHHIAFRVDDPQKARDELVSQGISLVEGTDKVRYLELTGRTLGNILPSDECLGEWYVQLVGPERGEPV